MKFQTDNLTDGRLTPARLNTQSTIHELLANRRSPRAFSEQPVEPRKIASLFEAARWSPSCANEQPWYFIVATPVDTVAYRAFYESLNEGNRRWVTKAPLIALGVARSTFDGTGRPNRHAWYDLGQSVAHLSVQATALGLVVHQMAGFDPGKFKQLYPIPDGYEAVVMFAVGYPGRPDDLPEDLRKREETPRSRKLLESFVFTDRWGTPSCHIPSESVQFPEPSKN
jgi:nitroreductase